MIQHQGCRTAAALFFRSGEQRIFADMRALWYNAEMLTQNGKKIYVHGDWRYGYIYSTFSR